MADYNDSESHNSGWVGTAQTGLFLFGVVGGQVLNKMRDDPFYEMHSHFGARIGGYGKYVRKAEGLKKKGGKAAVDAYTDKAYSQYASEAAGYAAETAKGKTAEVVLDKAAFKSQISKSMARRTTGKILEKALWFSDVLFMAPMLYGAAYHGFRGVQRLGYQLARPNFGGNMTMSTAAFTDRQRRIELMHNSEMNGRSAIGQEAFLLHR
jgi:hypothetical protein